MGTDTVHFAEVTQIVFEFLLVKVAKDEVFVVE